MLSQLVRKNVMRQARAETAKAATKSAARPVGQIT